jgi:hypothetical protein
MPNVNTASVKSITALVRFMRVTSTEKILLSG